MNSMAGVMRSAKGRAVDTYDSVVLDGEGSHPDSVAQTRVCATPPLPGQRLAHLELPAIRESVRAARHMAVAWLALWGLESGVAELLLSELTTNAVRTILDANLAGGKVAVELADSDESEWLEISVWDPFGTTPELKAPESVSEDTEGGRGLFLVKALSVAWGQRKAATGKYVWARVARIQVPAEVAA